MILLERKELLLWLIEVKELLFIQEGISERPNRSTFYCRPEKAGSEEDCGSAQSGLKDCWNLLSSLWRFFSLVS